MSAAASATRASTIPRRPSSPGRRGGCAGRCKWVAHPQRVLRLGLSGPRPSDPRRARARRGGAFPRASRRHRGQHRRLCLDLRRRHPERDLQRAAGRRVPHAGDRRAIDRRVHQHGADRRLSRRRPPGGLLCAGAPRRRGGARARHRSRRDPAAQSRAGRGHALQDADRADLRLRQLSEGVFAARRDRRLQGLRQAAGRAAARTQKAARLRHRLLCGVIRRRAVAHGSGAWARASASSRRRRSACSTTAACRRLLGTHNHGQGHATTFAQIIASRLGVPMASVEIIEGDTDQVPYGSGTFGSRSIAVGGSALDRAAMKVIEKGKKIAAHLLEASAGDIAFADGMFAVAGTDRRVTLREVARVAHHPDQLSRRPGARPAGQRGLRPAELRLEQRRARLRGRGRLRHRRHRHRRLLGRGRRRHRDQSDDRRRPDPGRHRAGARPGDARALRLRSRQRAAAVRLVHGLRGAARDRHAGRSSPSSTRASPAPTIRSAPRAAARPDRSARRPPSSAPCSMRCGRSASPTSKCR